ncbi:MAG: hypothetical protein ACRDTC_01810 [Pseudonocardiaceae bacterium]
MRIIAALVNHVDPATQRETVTPLNPAGLKIDGVAYTNQQTEREGWTIMF